MKTIFRKAMTVLGSAAMIGASIGAAAAASYPAPFTSDTAIVVGANAAPSDNIAATEIAANLDAANAGSTVTTLSGGSGVTENEVPLGGLISVGEIKAVMDEGEIAGLLDESVSWDDGNGAEDYDMHEEIRIGAMYVNTTLDDEDFEGVALGNDEGLSYRLVFDDMVNVSLVGDNDADDLYLTILGRQYEVSNMVNSSTDSITVVTSEEITLEGGESVTVDGKVFTLDRTVTGKAQVNGEFINEGASEKVDGMRVEVDTVVFEPDANQELAILRIGEEISEQFSSGDAYVGEDDKDPLWVWDIDFDLENPYIGVVYRGTNIDAKDDDAGDSVKYVGDSYVMPGGFAAVSLDEVDERSYEDVFVNFEENVDLFSASAANDEFATGDVAVITIPEGSYQVSQDDTTSLYVYFNSTEADGGEIQFFYKDIEGQYDPNNEARLIASHSLSSDVDEFIATDLEIGETLVDISINVTNSSGQAYAFFYTEDDSDAIRVDLGDTVHTEGFVHMGAEAEDAEEADVMIGAKNVGTIKESIMTNYGVLLSDGSDIEDETGSDELTLSFPDEQVYATVSVLADGEVSTSGDAGVMTYTDDKAPSNMNLIVVGGSAINSVAAELLGGAYREAEFTSMTGVAAGEALIQSFARSGKTALLVAGYNAADTSMAATYLNNEDVDTAVGTKLKVMSATEATVVTE